MTKHAIIYTRFSPRPNAKECDSCEKQLERCTLYCKNKGYNIFAAREDKDISGKYLLRPGLQDIFQLYLKPGMVLVVDSHDRLARDTLVALAINKQVTELGCTIEFADGTPGWNNADDKLISDILSAVASHQRSKIAEKTKAGLARKKANGEWIGRPPYGYNKNKDRNTLERNNIEQDRISYICDMWKCGRSFVYIKNYLQNMIGNCRKKPWTVRMIRTILKREKLL